MVAVSRPYNDPGPDVGERHRAIHISMLLSLHLPNPRTRLRAGKEYPREDVLVHRSARLTLDHTHLDPVDGPRRIGEAVGRHLYRVLTFEGWPVQSRSWGNRHGVA